jgi:hypothetical protein
MADLLEARWQAAEEVGRSHAGQAFDQRGAFDSPSEAYDSYLLNLIDTLRENQAHATDIDAAVEAYDAEWHRLV